MIVIKRTRISTLDVPPEQRLKYWEDSIIGGIRCDSLSEQGLEATLKTVELAPYRLLEVVANEHTLQRSPTLVSRHEKNSIMVSLAIEGKSFFFQGEMAVSLEPGDMILYDASHAYFRAFPNRNRQFVIIVPKAQFDCFSSKPPFSSAIKIDGSLGFGKTIFDSLNALASRLFDENETVDFDRTTREFNLHVNALLEAVYPEMRVTASARATLMRVKAFISERLADPTLDIETVSRAQRLSARQLNRLFEATGTTLGTWLRDARLERCAIELRDSSFRNSSVQEIARRWGFKDSAHFSRVFKAKYGTSPSAHRAT